MQAIKKEKREKEQDKVRIKNITKLQNIPLQLYGKNSRNAVNQLCIQIGPNKSVDLPVNRLIADQIKNLKKRKMITVIRVGIGSGSGSDIGAHDYRQFLPKKKDQSVDVTKSSKGFAPKAAKSTTKSKTSE